MPATAWRRTVEVARWAEDRGFESLWVYDHMQVDPPPEEAPIFEPFVELAALAVDDTRARLGHLVLAAAYRNAGLTAKAISTIDVISGGRAILGIGAGWKEDEWLAYGYGFPPAPERLADPRRPPRDHQPDARAGPGDVRGPVRPRPRRDPRAEGPAGAAASRSSSVATARR